MAELQKLLCDEHGGYFYREPKRGQKPKRCGGSNAVCDAATNAPVEQEPETRVVKSRAANTASVIKNRRVPKGSIKSYSIGKPEPEPEPAVKATERKAPARNGANPSLDKGKAAKELLEAQGWTVAGKAWVQPWEGNETGQDYWASVTAARGEETIFLTWVNGEVREQTYSLWNVDKPSANGKPRATLPFDPEEVGDQRLAQILSGASVTWYNKLSGKEETGVIGDKVTVEHLYNGEGDETPGARIIKFVDHTLGHFKAFRLDQLLKVR